MNKFVYTSDFNFLWKNMLSPMGNSFCFPYEMIFFHQYHSEQKSPTNKHEIIFLRDGVLGLMPLISDLIKRPLSKYPRFAISKNMAPLIPTIFKKQISFYEFNSSPPNNSFKNILIFLGTLPPYTSSSILLKQLNDKRFDNFFIIRDLFEESTEIEILNRKSSPIPFLDRYKLVQEQLANRRSIDFSLEEFLNISNFNEYHLVNTDHYNFFHSLDFFSYYYYFRTGIYPENYFKPNPSFFHKIGENHLVKNLSVGFYEYDGPCIIDEDTIDFLSLQYFPQVSNPQTRPGSYYTRDVVNRAETLAEKLFQFNLENNFNAP